MILEHGIPDRPKRLHVESPWFRDRSGSFCLSTPPVSIASHFVLGRRYQVLYLRAATRAISHILQLDLLAPRVD